MASHHPSHNRNPYNYVYLDPYENGLMNMAVFPWQYGIATIDRCPCLTMFFFIIYIYIYIVPVRYVSLLEGNSPKMSIFILFIGPVLTKITLLRVIPTMTFQNSLLTPLLSEAFVTGLLPN